MSRFTPLVQKLDSLLILPGGLGFLLLHPFPFPSNTGRPIRRALGKHPNRGGVSA